MTPSGPTAADRLSRWEQWLDLGHEAPLDPQMPVIDPHHHLWDRGGHTYLGPQFAADASGHNVVATVYVECLSHYRSRGPEYLRPVGETEFVAQSRLARVDAAIGLCAGIVGHADLSMGQAVDEVLDAHEMAGEGRFKGVRYVTAWDADPAIHRAYPTHSAMLRTAAVQAGAKALAARRWTLDVWLYFHQLADVTALAAACPGLSIVVDHCGGPIGIQRYASRRADVFREWNTALLGLRPFGNVAIKLGGLAMALAGFGWHRLPRPPSSLELAAAWRPYFETCLEIFGPDRCMFESNFPVDRAGCSYTTLWNAFKTLAADLPAPERRALLAATASRIYRL